MNSDNGLDEDSDNGQEKRKEDIGTNYFDFKMDISEYLGR